MVPKPRLCTLVKHNPTEEYGFNLHAEKGRGHYIGLVDEDGIADFAGLQTGQRLVGVNGRLIHQTTTHREVLELVREDPLRVELLLASEDIDRWHLENQIPYSYENHIVFHTNYKNGESRHPGMESRPHNGVNPREDESAVRKPRGASCIENRAQAELMGGGKVSAMLRSNGNHHRQSAALPHADLGAIPRPRLCLLGKTDPAEEYGFNLHAERGKGHFIGAVDKNGIAERAGLETAQRIVGVNGQLIFPSTAHKDVVALIKRDPLVTELLVASEEVDRWYGEHRLSYSYTSVEQAAPVLSAALPVVNGHPPSSCGKFSPGPFPNGANRPKQLTRQQGNRDQNTMGITRSRSSHSGNASSSSFTTPSPADEKKAGPPQRTFVGEPISIEVNRSSSNSITGVQPERGGQRRSTTGTADELLGKVLSEVKPPPTKELRPQNEKPVNAAMSIPRPHVINNGKLPTDCNGNSHRLPQKQQQNQVVPAPDYGPCTESSLSSPDSSRSQAMDSDSMDPEIFKMKPKEVQKLIAKRKREARLHSAMSFEEKHSVINSL